MTIYIENGDLLKSNCTIIAHQANCFSTMGAGIAKQIAKKYPESYNADRSCGMSPEERLGKFSVVLYENPSLVICNLYGQYHYGRDKQHTDYNALRSALNYMFKMISMNQYSIFNFPIKIGMPYGMGAGLAGGDWSIIYRIIEETSSAHNHDVYLYKL